MSISNIIYFSQHDYKPFFSIVIDSIFQNGIGRFYRFFWLTTSKRELNHEVTCEIAKSAAEQSYLRAKGSTTELTGQSYNSSISQLFGQKLWWGSSHNSPSVRRIQYKLLFMKRSPFTPLNILLEHIIA